MLDELNALIQEQRKDQMQGPFQRPEPGVINFGRIIEYLDESGRTSTTRNLGGKMGRRRNQKRTGKKGRPRTCPHGDTYRKQRYREGKKWGTYCTECARIKTAEWRANGGSPRTEWDAEGKVLCSTPECGGEATCRTFEPESRIVLVICATCAHVAATMGHRVKTLKVKS